MRAARIALAIVILVVSCLPPALFLLFMFGPRFQSDFERGYHGIQDGMTAAEVRTVLGTETNETTEDTLQAGGQNAVRGDRVLVWEKNGQFIRIGFINERVVSKFFYEYDL